MTPQSNTSHRYNRLSHTQVQLTSMVQAAVIFHTRTDNSHAGAGNSHKGTGSSHPRPSTVKFCPIEFTLAENKLSEIRNRKIV